MLTRLQSERNPVDPTRLEQFDELSVAVAIHFRAAGTVLTELQLRADPDETLWLLECLADITAIASDALSAQSEAILEHGSGDSARRSPKHPAASEHHRPSVDEPPPP